ncbi:hypothetical protein [Arthrobacter sp. BE255]|uniref:hypothetical protein n=1 Tax=Arthrobacter sp. BE255 TaxID=2817721 RepID=UPI00286087D9|nr:mannitol-1-phosphate/altronate dehydrogenase [Arthrobacter sp. BE255]
MPTLSNYSLPSVPGPVSQPAYNRSRLTEGIVHFGVGGFHRAHQAMYLDRLMNAGKAHDWAICGVGVLPSHAHMKKVMDSQDCHYTLTVKHADGTRQARIIGSITSYLFAPDNPEAVIEKMASPAIRIVSLTVTEGGYNFHRRQSCVGPCRRQPRSKTTTYQASLRRRHRSGFLSPHAG